MRTVIKNVLLAMIATLLALAPAQAGDTSASDPAAATIATFYAALTDTMRQGKALGMEGRSQKLAPAIDAAFDLPSMAQFMVGPGWTSMPQADRDAVVRAFRRYTISDYAHNFSNYDGQRFVVDPNVIARGPDHVVQTKLITQKGDPVILNYRMRQSGPVWKIIDVFLEGYVSQLALRRSDFASTVASGGGPALAKKLDTLSDAMK